MYKLKLSQLFANCAWNVPYQEVGDGVNYAFVEEGDHLFIYFQGSYQVTDWVRNFLFKKRPYKDMKIPYRVHRGFCDAWKEVEDIVIAKIQEKIAVSLEDPEAISETYTLENDFDYKWKHITIVGYSHGGALAAFCHECVWFWRPDLRKDGLVGYGFEAPRIYGGFSVKDDLKERWATFKVIRCNNDIVTHCPPFIFRFCHVSSIIQINGDISLAPQKWYIPKCVKSHFPQVVYDGLIQLEKAEEECCSCMLSDPDDKFETVE